MSPKHVQVRGRHGGKRSGWRGWRGWPSRESTWRRANQFGRRANQFGIRGNHKIRTSESVSPKHAHVRGKRESEADERSGRSRRGRRGGVSCRRDD